MAVTAVLQFVRCATSCSAMVPQIWADAQVQDKWKVQARLRPYRDSVLTLLQQIPTWSIEWIPRYASAPSCKGELLTMHCDTPADGVWFVHAVGGCRIP